MCCRQSLLGIYLSSGRLRCKISCMLRSPVSNFPNRLSYKRNNLCGCIGLVWRGFSCGCLWGCLLPLFLFVQQLLFSTSISLFLIRKLSSVFHPVSMVRTPHSHSHCVCTMSCISLSSISFFWVFPTLSIGAVVFHLIHSSAVLFGVPLLPS